MNGSLFEQRFAETVHSVSEINGYVKEMISSVPVFGNLRIRGEISNCVKNTKGHIYFSLKDERSVIKAVIFAGSASNLKIKPENGMKVIAGGRLTVYEAGGVYQIVVSSIEADGKGALYEAYEKLKNKLEKEGLFSEKYKKKLPRYPMRIGVITSPTGAAVRDIVRTAGERWPVAEIVIYPATVQGIEAEGSLIRGVRYFEEEALVDVVIIGRGGGSIEDLWAFNEEEVARAIFNCPTPVISAVGHETDTTISDFVADLRAATPSNAAELAVPDQGELRERLLSLQTRLAQAETKRLKLWRQEVEKLRTARVLQSPTNYLEDRRLLVDYQQNKLLAAVRQALLRKKQGYVRLRTALESMSPMGVLARGYAMTRDGAGRVITDSAALHIGDTVTITLRQGEADAAITAIRGGSHGREEDL